MSTLKNAAQMRSARCADAPTPLDALDRQRAASAGEGHEVLLDTDANDADLASLNATESVRQLAGDLARAGLALRLLPASYAALPVDRRRTSTWIDEGVLHIGVRAGARAGTVLRAGARVLAMAQGYPTPDQDAGPLCRLVGEAIIEAFSFSYLAANGQQDEVHAATRTLGVRLSDRRLDGSLNAADVGAGAAAHTWALLSALDDRFAAQLLSQVTHIDAQVGERAERLAKLCPGLPTAAQAQGVAESFARELR